MMLRKPFFCVILRDGELWQVEAEWPDGTIELIDKFKAHFEALHWIKIALRRGSRSVSRPGRLQHTNRKRVAESRPRFPLPEQYANGDCDACFFGGHWNFASNLGLDLVSSFG